MIGIGRWRLGRRGAFLTLFGTAYILIGQSLLTTEQTPLVRHVFRFGLSILPLHGWGIAWIVCGSVAILDGLYSRGRDLIGFVAAVLAPLAWSFVYLVAWIQLDVRGVANLWQSSLLYAVLAAAVMIVAGMPEPRAMGRVLDKVRPDVKQQPR